MNPQSQPGVYPQSFLALVFQYGIAISAGLSAMVAGAWLSWPAAAIPVLRSGELGFNATSSEISTMVSIMDFGNVLSPFPSTWFMNRVGRKPTILFTAVLYIASVLCAQYAQNMLYLHTGRFLAGVAKGVGFAVVPLYVAEIASPKVRGGCSTMFFGGLNAGIMYGYLIGPFMSYTDVNWAIGVIPLVFGLTFLFAPESPYYLIMKNKEEEAKLSLSKFRRKPVTDENLLIEFKNIHNGVQKDLITKGKITDLFKTKGNRRAITIVIILSFGQRCTGVSPILAYSSITLPPEGGGASPGIYLIIFSVLFFLSNYVGTALVDSLGRKPILIISLFLCMIDTLFSGLFYNFDYEGFEVTDYRWVPYVTLVLFAIFYNLGIGFLPSTFVGELFGTDVKGFASGISAVILALTSMTINKTYQIVTDTVGVHWMFYTFTVNSFIMMVFSIIFVFETKGKPLEQIHDELRSW